MGGAASIAAIEDAAREIDSVFLNSPQYVSEPLSQRTGLRLVSKIESANPLRCFKGRGADFWMARQGKDAGRVVVASAGNFGMAMAYAGRKRGVSITVFVAETANPAKVEAIAALGADIRVAGADFDAAKDAARKEADVSGRPYVEDGREREITEGAGTMGLELARFPEELDAVFVPVGNGALIGGVGAALKAKSPTTKIIAVGAEGAPCMRDSWRVGKVVTTARAETIADGVAARVPVPESLPPLAAVIDDYILVSDDDIVAAMRLYFEAENLIAEPAGAVSLAAAMAQREKWRGRTVATILCGSNIDPRRRTEWLGRG